MICDSTTGYDCDLYLNLGDVNALHGGTTPVPTGSALTTNHAYQCGYGAGPPSNNTVYATNCADLVSHIKGGAYGSRLTYVGFGNEMETGAAGGFWEDDGLDDAITCYRAFANAIDALDLGIKFVACEAVHFRTTPLAKTWTQAFIDEKGTNGTPLDVISLHMADGLKNEAANIKNQTDAWCTDAGIDPLPVVLSEGNLFEIADINGGEPWSYPVLAGPDRLVPDPPIHLDPLLNAFAAGCDATIFIKLQELGAPFCVITDMSEQRSPYLRNGVMVVELAPYNMALMWDRLLGLDVLEMTWAAGKDPGVEAVCCRNGSTYYVFFASWHYRPASRLGVTGHPVLVKLPDGVTDGTSVTQYVVSDTQSNVFDAGEDHAVLETAAVQDVSGGAVGFILPQNGAALLVVG